LIVDEVHHVSAETWLEVANSCDNAWWRFGFSGTVVAGSKLRNLKLEGATGPIYVTGTTMELAEKGFLAKPLIVMRKIDRWSYPSYEEVRQEVCPGWRSNPRQLRPLGGKLFATAYRMGIIENKERNESIAKIACTHWMQGRKILVLCTKIAHGKRIVQHVLDGKDMRIRGLWWLHGSESDKVREEALLEFRESKLGGVMVASTIFDEGVDIPEIDVLILAGAGESMIKSIQRIGRALRPRADKDHVLIYDFADGRGGHEKDYLKNHALRRVSDYRDQGFEVEE
jgi:superfamily II DNA or RNA helicase